MSEGASTNIVWVKLSNNARIVNFHWCTVFRSQNHSQQKNICYQARRTVVFTIYSFEYISVVKLIL